MTGFEQIIVLALAVWRVSYMLAREEGPAGVFVWLRRTLGAREVMQGLWQADNTLGKLVLCPLCLSVWLAMPAALLMAAPTAPWLVATWLAISGLSCLAQLLTSR